MKGVRGREKDKAGVREGDSGRERGRGRERNESVIKEDEGDMEGEERRGEMEEGR